MKLPGFKRIVSTEFPAEFRTVIDKLSYILNQNIEVIYTALNKRASLDDNIDCVVKEVELSVDSDGIPLNTTTFQLTDKTRNIQGLHIIRCDNLTNSATYPTAGVFASWDQIQTGIKLNHITGLLISNKYRLKIVAYY